jgi:XTP/dITP diphosphohydrolase
MISGRLLLASSNQHKLGEFRQMMPDAIELVGLRDIGFSDEIPEPYDTFEENALAKTAYVFRHTGIPCFADDSGLEVDALDGRPGVRSARYAGEGKGSAENVQKVLAELSDHPNRSARFVAVIAFQPSEKESFLFKGKVEGTISYEPKGEGGFGYDPVFIPAGFDLTFAQLPQGLKNQISHRAKALARFLSFLKNS